MAILRTFAGGRLFGSRLGDDPPQVLALHGWGRTHRDFDAALGAADPPTAIASVALDLPGFGASPPPDGGWGSAEYAECVAAVLDEMATPVVILGHSFGGRVAVHLAASRPEAVRALVLTGVPLLRLAPPRRPAAGYRLIRGLHRLDLVSERRLEAARRRYGSTDYGAAQGVMRQVHVRVVSESYEAQLLALQCPLRLVWGDDDTETPVEIARRTAELTGAELVVCPHAGHLTPLTAPEALRASVLASLG